MTAITFPAGISSDTPWATTRPRVVGGRNIRWRKVGSGDLVLETKGLSGALLDINGNPVRIVWKDTSQICRDIFVASSAGDRTYIVCASPNEIHLVYPDDSSTVATGVRFTQKDITPRGLSPVTDFVRTPTKGEMAVTAGWAFADDGNWIVMARRGANDQLYSWDRKANQAVRIPNSPRKAVSVAILNRILIAFGAESFTPKDVSNLNTIRWSDRLDYEEWRPSDINVSGEDYVENGSRILAGGSTGFGPVCWTDKSIHLLGETGDIGTVIGIQPIDTSRGIISTRGWCEADGRVWWLDQHRELNVFDGGRPRQIPNPIKAATLERLSLEQGARIALMANAEFNEVLIGYSELDYDYINRVAVYNYALDCWYFWTGSRVASFPRIGVFPPLSVDHRGVVFFNELDMSLPAVYLTAFDTGEPPATDPPLQITTTILSEAQMNSAYSFQLNASSGTPPYHWSGVLLPAWASLSDTGLLTGTPAVTDIGTTQIEVQVRDSETPVETQTEALSLTVTNLGELRITTLTLPLPQQSVAYSQQVVAEGGGTGNYAFDLDPASNPLPSWLTLSGAGLLSGTPPVGSAGNAFQFTVRVQDSGKSDSELYALEVQP